MAHLYKFGIENFRVFADYTEFEFAPITILTGPNNSGKSSLTKCLSLLKSYLVKDDNYHNTTLDYSQGNHNLAKHEYVANNIEKPLRMVFPTVLKGIEDPMMVSIEFIKDTHSQLGYSLLKSIRLFAENKKEEVFSCVYKNNLPPRIYVNFKYFDKKLEHLITTHKVIQDNIKDESKRLNKKLKEDDLIKLLGTDCYTLIDIPSTEGKLSFIKYPLIKSFHYLGFMHPAMSKFVEFNHPGIFFDYLISTNRVYGIVFLNFLLQRGEIDAKTIINITTKAEETYGFINFTEDFAFDYIEENTFLTHDIINDLYDRYIEYLDDDFNFLINHIEYDFVFETLITKAIQNFMETVYDTNRPFKKKDKNCTNVFSILASTPKPESSDSAVPSFDRKKHDCELNLSFFIREIVGDNIKNILRNSSKYFEALNSLSIARASDQRLFGNDTSSNLTTETIQEFVRLKPFHDQRAKRFLEKWLTRFDFKQDIGGGIEVLSLDKIQGLIFELNHRPVADLGTGTKQLLPIVLKIVNIYASCLEKSNLYSDYKIKRKRTSENVNYRLFHTANVLIIEEPESSLHPRLQSLLADMFIDANKQFNIQFILETHSEYLIRKLQYLTAEGKQIAPSDTVIYYFHDPNNVPEGEKQIKRINFLEDGQLSDTFGPGFYDEAVDLKFDLLRIRSEKHGE